MRWVVLVAVLLLAPAVAQVQPLGPPDVSGFTSREDVATAGDLDGAQRILRFAQVSDAHIIDDDAPAPMRVGLVDPVFGPYISQAERPVEEYTDELLVAMVAALNSRHAEDPLEFIINTGDNIDNQLENELMRFIDVWDGTLTTDGPISGLACAPDGQSASLEDDDNDVTDQCTSLPEALGEARPGLDPAVPWFSAFGNHDGLIQGNMPNEPGFQELAAQYGRYFLQQEEYVAMHFAAGSQCAGGTPAGVAADDNGHGFGYAGERLCDEDPDNDGYYSFSMRGVHFVVLDTLNDDFVTANENLQGLFPTTEVTLGRDIIGGYAEGAIDPAQFAWLTQEIEGNQDKLIVLMAHHTTNSMFSSQVEGQCAPAGCLADLVRDAGYKTGPELIEFLAGHDNVAAWIGGHTHKHRIQPKTGDDGGFWNIETSAIIDTPQEARVVELWQTMDGKAFLKLDRVIHDDDVHRAIAEADPLASPAAAGEAVDRDVLLWLDVPADVLLTPQPSLPRSLNLFARGAPTAELGEPYDFEVAAVDMLTGANVSGLSVILDIGHPGDQGFHVVVPVDTVANETRPGHYGITFTPNDLVTHFATVTATDPSGLYPDRTQVVSIIITGDPPVAESPGIAPVLLLIGLAFAVRQKR